MFPMDMGPAMWLVMLLVPLFVVAALLWFGVFVVRHVGGRKATGLRQNQGFETASFAWIEPSIEPGE